MPEFPPEPEDQLLNAHVQPRNPKPRPPKVARTPTRKEIVIPPSAGGGHAGKRVRRATMVERTIDEPGDTAEMASFRPRLRPPMALLTILDDGDDDGEDVRLRDAVTVIGRSQGEVTIPHDEQMSGRHAEIRRAQDGGRWTWTLTDLGSTNGTFVRVHKCSVKPGQELLVGHTRFRFEDGSEPILTPEMAQGTAPWQSVAGAGTAAHPALVELTSRGDGRRWPLAGTEATIGRQHSCTIVLDDPMVGDRHVRLWREERGWRLESHESRDGVWIRIEKPVTVDRTCSFQLGEQRFVLKVL